MGDWPGPNQNGVSTHEESKGGRLTRYMRRTKGGGSAIELLLSSIHQYYPLVVLFCNVNIFFPILSKLTHISFRLYISFIFNNL